MSEQKTQNNTMYIVAIILLIIIAIGSFFLGQKSASKVNKDLLTQNKIK